MNTNAQILGIDRQNAHPNGTPRYYSDPNAEDIIGIAGELEFAKQYQLNADTEIRPDGDGHVDFKIQYKNKIITFDVKTAIKAYNLLIKEWEIDVCADVLVLAQYNPLDKQVSFIGWTTNKIMKEQPTKVFSSLGINNYYLHKSKLFPMERISKFFIEKKQYITQVIE